MYEVAAILEIISSISSTLALDETLARVTEKTAQVVGADSCAISLWDQLNDTLIVLADYIAPHVVIPADDVNDIGVSYPLTKFPVTARVLQQQIPSIIHIDQPTADEAEKNLLRAFQWASVLMAPMLYKGQTIGLMELYADHGRPCPFNPDNVVLCQALANQAAVAIENARLFTELDTQREALRQVSLQLVKTQEEERRRLSRELHDELGQTLTALKINVDRARRMLTPEAPPNLRRALEEASSLAGQTQERARHLSLELRPVILDDLGLIPALRWELDCYEQRTGCTVHFEANLAEMALPPELEITLYRIISEALTNIARHAQANVVRICLRGEDSSLIASVEDDGLGFDAASWSAHPTERPSLGLLSMRERAQLLGGRLKVTSEVGHGTRVIAQFPLT